MSKAESKSFYYELACEYEMGFKIVELKDGEPDKNLARIIVKSTKNDCLEVRELNLDKNDSDKYLRSIANIKDKMSPDHLAFDTEGEQFSACYMNNNVYITTVIESVHKDMGHR
jgi:transcriptional antiterminator Rof (Rho-off)